jgi:phenylalanyl-tRNA synthetase alpha chain
MKEKLEELRDKALTDLKSVGDLSSLEAWETENLGRKSAFNQLLKGLGSLPPEGRQQLGRRANEIKDELTGALDGRRHELESAVLADLAETEKLDVSLPGIEPPTGHLHLVSQAISEIEEIFKPLGFYRPRQPEVEWDWYAFEALNMPADHPARDEWETFFVEAPPHHKLGRMVLTPHTSSGQVREMQRRRPPIRMIGISKCYRRQMDISHVPMFHQFEGLLIDKGIAVTHLKGVLDHFARSFFGPQRVTRLRPYHFQFTEPSFEVDITCGVCNGSGKLPPGPDGAAGAKCRLCKDGWLELGGAGMVHPNVLKAGGLDPEEWGGFAFGWGVERTMMMRSGLNVPDIRVVYRGDRRFLEQF